MLSPTAANLLVFGGQVTLHDRTSSGLTDETRREVHFGQVVTPDEWERLHAKIVALGYLMSAFGVSPSNRFWQMKQHVSPVGDNPENDRV